MNNQSEVYSHYIRHSRFANELKLKPCLMQTRVLGQLSGGKICEDKDFFDLCYQSVPQL